MTQPPNAVRNEALAYFGLLVADDASLPLLEAAASIAQDEEPGLDVQAVLNQVDALQARLLRQVRGVDNPLDRCLHLNRYFFETLRFGRHAPVEGDPQASHIHRVLSTRRGLPIALGVLWLELAISLDLPVHGISFPGRFLVGMDVEGGKLVLDPVQGETLSREDVLSRLRRQGRLEFPQDTPDDQRLSVALRPASSREILARMLRNLQHLYRQQGDVLRQLAVQHRMVCVSPASWEHRLERARLLEWQGLWSDALEDLRVCEGLMHDSPWRSLLDEPLKRLHQRLG